MSKKLTAKQERFVQEYLVDLNATQAAIRAGYKTKYPDRIGFQLLENTRVAEAIKKKQEKRSKRTEITQDMVLKELALIGFSRMNKYVEFGPVGVSLKEMSAMGEDDIAAISEVSHNFNAEGGGSVKFKLYDKQSALVNLGKHLGMFTEKLKVQHEWSEELTVRLREAEKTRLKLVAGGTNG